MLSHSERGCLLPNTIVLVQGLGELGKHKSQLEKEKEAAAAARKTAGGSPALGRLPSYMRPTSASKAMQKVISQTLTICLDVSLTQSTNICCMLCAGCMLGYASNLGFMCGSMYCYTAPWQRDAVHTSNVWYADQSGTW